MLRSRARANPSPPPGTPRPASPLSPSPRSLSRARVCLVWIWWCGGIVPCLAQRALPGLRSRLSAHTYPISSIVIHSRDSQPAREAVHHTIHYAFISFDKSVPRRLGTGTVTISTESAASVRTDRLIASPPPLPRPSTSLGLISEHEAPRASGAFHLPPRNTSHPIPDQDQDHKRNPHLASAHVTPSLLRLLRGPSNAPRTCASTNSGESKNAVERPREPSIQLGTPTNDHRTPSLQPRGPPTPPPNRNRNRDAHYATCAWNALNASRTSAAPAPAPVV